MPLDTDLGNLGTLIRAWRDRALLTQEELANRTGIHVRTIRRLEGGLVERPRSTSIRMLARALNLDTRERAMLAAAAHRTPAGADEHGPAATPVATHGVPSTPRQLPVGVASFAGRDGALAELDHLLGPGGSRIRVISGTAGTGKTALALHWAHRARDRFGDGQLYVDLHGFGRAADPVDPGAALTHFLQAMGVPPSRIPDDLPARSALYRTVLADKRVLVVLDNARDVEQVRPLLPGSPHCAVLVTSRGRFTGLVVAEDARPLTLGPLTDGEARELLAARFAAAGLAAKPETIDMIVTRCAGLPLALAITAAHAASYGTTPAACPGLLPC